MQSPLAPEPTIQVLRQRPSPAGSDRVHFPRGVGKLSHRHGVWSPGVGDPVRESPFRGTDGLSAPVTTPHSQPPPDPLVGPAARGPCPSSQLFTSLVWQIQCLNPCPWKERTGSRSGVYPRHPTSKHLCSRQTSPRAERNASHDVCRSFAANCGEAEMAQMPSGEEPADGTSKELLRQSRKLRAGLGGGSVRRT